jgi:hypothetical protein
MAAAPQYKIYDLQGEYMGACKEVEGASALVSFYGLGATIRNGHTKKTTVWTEGADGWASHSYDVTGEIIRDRIQTQFGHSETA